MRREINAYRRGSLDRWTGRQDLRNDDLAQRWYQHIKTVDLSSDMGSLLNTIVLLGFQCDQGVYRNQGRIGAKEGPDAIRAMLGNLPILLEINFSLMDGGDVYCEDQDLEGAQMALADAVEQICRHYGFPVLIGGGHEMTWGHYQGLRRVLSGSIGIINIDAHFDLRVPVEGKGSSGTGFFQIAEHVQAIGEPFHYLALGIQEISNTADLFKEASTRAVEVVLARDMQQINQQPSILERIQRFAARVDHLYLTIDLDAFASPYAPGVSAPAYNGIVPNGFLMHVLDTILKTPHLCAVDIAELNPRFDQDNRTARLAAELLFRAVAVRSSIS